MDITDLVKADLEARAVLGKAKYGARLDTDTPCANDKSALENLYEELLDAACYTKKAILDAAMEGN